MRSIDPRALTGRGVDAFDSVGFQTLGLAARGRVTLARLAPGGRIGSHVAPVEQLLVVLAGDAEVTGGAMGETEAPVGADRAGSSGSSDGQPSLHLTTGQAVVFEEGEPHETRSATGMTALLVESPELIARLEGRLTGP